MKTLTAAQAAALLAFCDSFDDKLTACWKVVSEEMSETHGIDDPEEALEDALKALRG